MPLLKMSSVPGSISLLVLGILTFTPPALTQTADPLTLRQDIVVVEGSSIPLSIVQLSDPQNRMVLKPIWPDPSQLVGLAELGQFAAEQGAVAAINGGFFNRNTQQPIGAIRVEGEWISSGVLGRGVVAWSSEDDMRFDRLQMQGRILTSSQTELPLQGLNTAYIVPGISQYTPAWGTQYTTQADNETIVDVVDNVVQAIYPTGAAGSWTHPIPPSGYLLVGRPFNGNDAIHNLVIGDSLTLSWTVTPPDLNHLPYVLGAGPLLMREGQIVLDAERERFQEGFRTQRAARSAIGRTADGRILLVTVGQAQELTGVTLATMATVMQQLGCRDALNLDGGSSSTLYYNGSVVNLPSSTRWIPRVHNGLGIIPRTVP